MLDSTGEWLGCGPCGRAWASTPAEPAKELPFDPRGAMGRVLRRSRQVMIFLKYSKIVV